MNLRKTKQVNNDPDIYSNLSRSSERVIRSKRGFVPIDFNELWYYRELLMFLVWRNLLIRYKQTLLGVLWSVIQPVVMMVIFTVIFGKLGKFPSGGVPYPILTLAAILPWQFFANSLQQGSQSLVGAQNMISKIYFPRLYIPVSACMAMVVDFFISLIILFGMMFWFDIPIRLNLCLIPVYSVIVFVTALSGSLWFSALNVKFRDIAHILPFIIRVGMYISPVGFMSNVIPEKWRFIYSINPLVGVIDGFRWAILGDAFEPYWPGFWFSIFVTIILFISGCYFFRYTEKTFADVI